MINQVRRYRRALNDTDHLDNKIYHIIQKIPESELKKELPLKIIKSRSRRSYPTVLYPEVLVIVDYSLNSKFGGNMKEILVYLLSYWNGVDMRFRGIKNPKIRLNIAGIMFAQDPWSLSYIKNYIEEKRANDYISKIESKGRWLYRMNSVIPIDSYDVAVTMMTHKMCDYQGCSILGVSPVGSACHVDHAHQTMYKVLIVRDTGAYEGISSTVHELGHAFGMNHDGQINRGCPSQNGFIMAPSDVHTPQQFDWSLCSLIDLQNFVKMNPKCMLNKPHQGKQLQRFLPGKLMDANKQCQMLNALRAFVINDSICLRLQCVFGINALFSDYVIPSAAEGTPCGVGKICLHGKCIYESQITYIHHRMTKNELIEIFGVETLSEVPHYDVVSISVTKSQNHRKNLLISVKPFGKHIKMWLNPASGILAGEDMPIYKVSSDPDNKSMVDIQTDQNLIKSLLPQMYENTLYATTIAVNNHSLGQSLKGVIGDSFIQPVLHRLRNHVKKLKKLHHLDNRVYHIVHKIHSKNMHSPTLNVKASKISRSKNLYPNVIYPEILIIADYNFLKKFEKIEDAVMYLLTFWNGVDMRYRSLEHPKIRLNIAGIVVAQDPFVLRCMNIVNDKLMGSSNILSAMGKWLYFMHKWIPITSYDIAVTMSPFELCEYEYLCGVLGQVADVGAACHVSKKDQTIKKVAIIRDRAAFDGVNTAAHELGHMFGMMHDGQINRKCSEKHGFIMSPTNQHSKHSFEWSNCSLTDMQRFLKSSRASCLENKPNQGKTIERYLPGKLMDADQQCKFMKAGKALVIDDSICTQLKCLIEVHSDPLPEAAEGTPCGDGKLCLHGRCVSESSVTL
ncbi:A disintegrin and metalloproteinase with thrombospondin motifs adt-1-like [Cotesia glomerata]|uniref:A disintegrin and metalloproteinase with thrombospondin motifs adt-1-like n=1 Tax=Cotesia glomerata TaxID=32391 RepID=UPI001D006E34|nr:A disintegrin and metalloproteinase with thrombospondin motifs adt-1-like [Cotesia glomerata]